MVGRTGTFGDFLDSFFGLSPYRLWSAAFWNTYKYDTKITVLIIYCYNNIVIGISFANINKWLQLDSIQILNMRLYLIHQSTGVLVGPFIHDWNILRVWTVFRENSWKENNCDEQETLHPMKQTIDF